MSAIELSGVVLAYLLGSLPFGYVLVKLRGGGDVRARGSGSTGATNVARTLGPGAGLLVLALDAGKGYVAVWLAARLSEGDMRWTAAASVAAIVGHSFPVFIRFRGGKSVATGLGVFLFLTPLAVAACLGVWLSALAIWRYVSLSSMLATAAYPVLAYALYRPTLPVLLAGVVGACIIVLRHHANIRQLMAGTENKFALRRKS